MIDGMYRLLSKTPHPSHAVMVTRSMHPNSINDNNYITNSTNDNRIGLKVVMRFFSGHFLNEYFLMNLVKKKPFTLHTSSSAFSRVHHD